MNSKRFWDHSGKPSVFVEVKDGVEVYRGPFKGAKADKHAELKAEIENLRKERDEAIADRDILRIDAQREAEHHDRMVGELERVYKERDELLQWKNEVITNLIRENEKLKLERDEAREAAAKWESSFDAMERAGAEQARRADENREWALRAERERDEARSMTERQWLLRVGSRLCMAGCKSDGILDSIDEIIRERDEARGAIKSTIAWLKERRNAPDFTTMGMVEERLLKALEAAK